MLARSRQYYRQWKALSRQQDFDTIVSIDPILCYFFARHRSKDGRLFCFVNDDNNLFPLAQRGFGKKIVRLLYRRIERWSLTRADLVIANSRYLADLLRRSYHLDRIVILPKGVDLSLFPFRPPRVIDITKPVRILFMKNDFERGGLFILGDALQQLAHLSFQLTIVGIPRSTAERLAPILDNKNIDLVFIERCPRSEIAELLHHQDLFCVPSLREALGVGNLEALACGVPVVSTTAGGIPEATRNGDVAWLCRPGDSASLRSALLNCLQSDGERTRKVKLGREWVEEHFRMEQVYTNFINLCEAHAANT